jgi:hypothetical protein
MTKVKMPSTLEVSVNFSVYIFESMLLVVRIETIAYIVRLLAALPLLSFAIA